MLLKNNIVYLPKEHYCFVSFKNIRGILWVIFNAYGVPLLLLIFIYFLITIYLYRQPNAQTSIINQRQKRDLIIIRRIIMNVSILSVLGVSSIIFLFLLFITGEEHPLIFRISILLAGLSMTGLSVTTVLTTPKLKGIFVKK